MPTIDAHRAYRSFTVEPGAYLDLRWCRLYRGKPIRIIRRCVFWVLGVHGWRHVETDRAVRQCIDSKQAILFS